MVSQAVEHYGDLHVLVNNAGILRDRFIVSVSEDEWDAVVRVHLKGHFCVTRFAAEYWKSRSKQGVDVKAAIVNTSSAAGLFGNPGQINYGAAKAGIVMMTIVEALELGRYGIRANAIAPVARTRLTEDVPMIGDLLRAPDNPREFDVFSPGNVSPLVAYLSSEDCELTGQVYSIHGGRIARFEGWAEAEVLERDHRLAVDELADGLPALGERSIPEALF